MEVEVERVTHEKAVRLAALRKVSVADAVDLALTRQLEDEERVAAKAAALMDVARRCAALERFWAHVPEGTSHEDHAALLYDDETGLPK